MNSLLHDTVGQLSNIHHGANVSNNCYGAKLTLSVKFPCCNAGKTGKSAIFFIIVMFPHHWFLIMPCIE